MKYTTKEVDTIMRHMGWNEQNPNYGGMKRTVAYALHYAREHRFDDPSDPLNIACTYDKYFPQD